MGGYVCLIMSKRHELNICNTVLLHMNTPNNERSSSALPLAGRLNINNVIFNKDFDQSICTQQHDAAAAAVADGVRSSTAVSASIPFT